MGDTLTQQSPGGPLPASLQPGYQPPMPAALAPPSQPQAFQLASLTPTATPPSQTPPVPSQGPSPQAQATPPVPPERQPVQPPGANYTVTRPFALPATPQQTPAPFSVGAQPGPWPAAYPNSPVFRSPQDYPALPGETPDETQHLNAFAWRESPGGNVMNQWAAKDAKRYGEGHTDQGYWQIVNNTWQDGAQRAGVDLRQYRTAMSAPYQVQRQVALALYRAYGDKPWAASAGAGQRGDRFQLASQTFMAPTERGSQDWGHPSPMMVGPQSQQPGAMPQQSEWGKILNTVSPLLLGIASLALRLPLSTAVTAYGAMARAQFNGQQLEYERNRTKYQDQLKEATAQQTLESQAASDAFSEYGTNNPQGLQQTLAQIALKYNDPAMLQMAERGDLNGIHAMQAKRDLYNQSLMKLSKAAEEMRDREAVDADVAARDRKWRQENPNATADDFAIAHNQHLGEAERAGDKTGTTGSGMEAPIYNVIGADGKPTGQQVREGKQGGHFDANTTQPVQLKPGETVQEAPRQGGGADALGKPKTGNYEWEDPQGKKHGPAEATLVPGKGLFDTNGNPIDAKPETIRGVSTTTAPQAESYPPGAGTAGYANKPNEPPPNLGISRGIWTQALTYVNTGKAPTFGRDKDSMARFREALPVAMEAMGVTDEQMVERHTEYAANRTREQRIEAAFAGGQNGKTLLALNTIAHHINLFRQYADAMQNGDFPLMNKLTDDLARAGGAAQLVDLNVVSRVTGDELVRVLTGTGGGTITDREDIAKQLSSYSSPEQFRGVADTLTNVIRGRFDPLQQAYSYGDPKKAEYFRTNMMDPDARRMFDAPQLPIVGAPGGSRQQPQVKPDWVSPDPDATRKMPDGRPIYSDGKGWFYSDHTPVQ
jgi:hypothetical protein